MTTAKTDSAAALVVERTFDAPVATVWKALTDVEQMREWYFDLKTFNPEPGFSFEFTVEHEGNVFEHLCQIKEVDPLRKLAYSWKYKGHPGNSLVTFELFPEGARTRLKVTHEGLETFPKTKAFARENFNQGWTALIGTSLREFLEGGKAAY